LNGQVDPLLGHQLIEFYKHYWDTLADAFITSDENKLEEVESGRELERDKALIRRLRQEGKAQRIEGEHSASVLYATSSEAVIYDIYSNRSLYVDLQNTPETSDTAPSTPEKLSFRLQLIDGKWRVIDGVSFT
jgi:hypothetical protein